VFSLKYETRAENDLQIKREEYHVIKASEETGDEDKLQDSHSGQFIYEYNISCKGLDAVLSVLGVEPR
jgi:hypothetical protein